MINRYKAVNRNDITSFSLVFPPSRAEESCWMSCSLFRSGDVQGDVGSINRECHLSYLSTSHDLQILWRKNGFIAQRPDSELSSLELRHTIVVSLSFEISSAHHSVSQLRDGDVRRRYKHHVVPLEAPGGKAVGPTLIFTTKSICEVCKGKADFHLRIYFHSLLLLFVFT